MRVWHSEKQMPLTTARKATPLLWHNIAKYRREPKKKKKRQTQANKQKQNCQKKSWLVSNFIYVILILVGVQFIGAISIVEMKRTKNKHTNDDNNKLFHVCLLIDPFNNHHISMSPIFHIVWPPATHMMHLVAPEHMLLSRSRVINWFEWKKKRMQQLANEIIIKFLQ